MPAQASNGGEQRILQTEERGEKEEGIVGRGNSMARISEWSACLRYLGGAQVLLGY